MPIRDIGDQARVPRVHRAEEGLQSGEGYRGVQPILTVVASSGSAQRRWRDLGRALYLGDQHRDLIDVAPRPVLAWLQGSDYRVPAALRVSGGVAVGRVITASDMRALQADAQVQPPVSRDEAILAAVDRVGQLREPDVI
jgi:hypothetical protein